MLNAHSAFISKGDNLLTSSWRLLGSHCVFRRPCKTFSPLGRSQENREMEESGVRGQRAFLCTGPACMLSFLQKLILKALVCSLNRCQIIQTTKI